MDVLIKQINNTDTVWYSEKYMETQIRLAFQAGLGRGMRVEFHALEPCDRESVDKLITEFENKRREEFNRCFENSEIVKRNLII